MSESNHFEIQVAFRVTGQGRIGADGIAIWYTAHQPSLGPVSRFFLQSSFVFKSISRVCLLTFRNLMSDDNSNNRFKLNRSYHSVTVTIYEF